MGDQAEMEKSNQDAFKAAKQHTSDMEAMLQELNAAKLANEHREEQLRNRATQQDADYAKLQEDLHFALEGWRLADGRLEDFKEANETSIKDVAVERTTSEHRQAHPLLSSHGDTEPLLVISLRDKLQQAITKCNMLE